MTERARLRTFVACNCPAGYAVRSATAIVDVLPEQLGGWISGTARQRPIAASLAPYLYDPRSKMTLVGKPAELVMRALARRNLLDAFAEAAGATELKPANWTWPSPDRRIDVQVCDDGSLQLTENVPTFSVATAVDAADAACGRT